MTLLGCMGVRLDFLDFGLPGIYAQPHVKWEVRVYCNAHLCWCVSQGCAICLFYNAIDAFITHGDLAVEAGPRSGLAGDPD